VSGIYAYIMDVKYPFTTAHEVVQYLEENKKMNDVLVTKSCNGTVISAYAEKPVFFTSTQSYASFCIFNRESNQKSHTSVNTITALHQLLVKEKSSLIFITYEPFFDLAKTHEWNVGDDNIVMSHLESFVGSIVSKGDHFVYEVTLE